DGLNDGGDVCDLDDDNDGLTDVEEAAAGTNPLLVDTDSDGVNDNIDNCPVDANTNQTNTDGVNDGGDVCDLDDDNDGTSDIDEIANGTDPLVPFFSLDDDTISLVGGDTHTITLEGAVSPSWALGASGGPFGVLSGTAADSRLFTANTGLTGFETLVVNDTLNGNPISDSVVIGVYAQMATDITTQRGIEVGSTLQINATGGDVSGYRYTSTSTLVATVSGTGLVTGVAAGTITSTVDDQRAYDGDTAVNNTTTAQIEVVDPLTVARVTVYLDTDTNTTSTIVASGAKGAYTYGSGNTAVAAVSNTGVITAVSAGTATITVTDGTYSNITTTVAVIVNTPLLLNDSDGNPITGTQTVSSGSSLTFTPSGGGANNDVQVTGPGGSCAACVTENLDGTGTFNAPTTGAFAGEYTVTFTDTDSGFETTMTISVPLTISVSGSGNILETDTTQRIIVEGGATGDAYTFTVFDAASAEDTAGAIAVVAGATAANNTAMGNPVWGMITPSDVTLLTGFSVRATNTTNGSLAAVTQAGLRVVPTVIYSGVIVNAAGNAVDGTEGNPALMVYARDLDDSAPVNATGQFSIVMPEPPTGAADHFFQVAGQGYITAEMDGAGFIGADNTATFLLTGADASISGVVSGLGDVDQAEIYAFYTDAAGVEQRIGPSAEVGNGAYTIGLDSSLAYTRVVAIARSYLAAVNSNEDTGFDLSGSDATEVDLALSRANAYTVVVTSGSLIFTFTETANETDISTYAVTATDSSGAAVTPALEETGDSLVATFVDDQDLDLLLIDDASGDVVFAYHYSVTERAATDGDGPSGSQQINSAAGFDASFNGTDPDALMNLVIVIMPANGLDTSAITGGVDSATIEVNLLNVGANGDASATGGQVVEVNLNIVSGGSLLGDTERNAALQEIVITIPFDTSVIAPGDIESGVYRIYQADSLADYQAGRVTAVPLTDIIAVDYVNGRVTFRVDHLTVFGGGAAVASSGSGSGGSGLFGCSVSNQPVAMTDAADWWLVMAFVTWMGLLMLRRRRVSATQR
ncbi:MAG: hypothetical protein GXP22_03850, partial [Gammaproteobacteria bacterium]|nr:hypothetical protein [Gammaproteobacteria bacterium]